MYVVCINCLTYLSILSIELQYRKNIFGPCIDCLFRNFVSIGSRLAVMPSALLLEYFIVRIESFLLPPTGFRDHLILNIAIVLTWLLPPDFISLFVWHFAYDATSDLSTTRRYASKLAVGLHQA